MTAQDIIDTALGMLDTPFVHQGRVPGVGLDCAGLVICVAARLGIEHFDVPAYGRTPHHGLLEQTLDEQPGLVRIGRDDIQPGDILLMRFAREPQHVAIYTGDGVIHSWSQPGKVCAHGLDATWRARIVHAYRFKEVMV